MPLLTRWYIKTSLVYLVLALVAGLILAGQSVWNVPPPAFSLFPTYLHLLVEGWVTMLIIGVAFWMFPKYLPDLPRGNETLAWAGYLLLNAGLVLRTIAEPVNGVILSPGSLWGILLAFAALLQWLGGMAFVANIWGRVKEK